jgi:hypothetical protein
MLKSALIVLAFFLLCAFNTAEANSAIDDMIIAVTTDGETIEWRLHFGTEEAESCFLSGDVRKGTSTNTKSQKKMSIAYVRAGDALIIESPPGICDAGAEAKLTLVNGLYEGDLYERSFHGYKTIGFVKEIRQ